MGRSRADGNIAQRSRLLLTGLIVSCGGSFHFGYEISLINPLADVLQTFLQTSLESRWKEKLDEKALGILWPTVAGLLFVGAFAGAVFAPKAMRSFGLKSTLAFSSFIICLSALMAAAANLLDSAEFFVSHRFVAGFGIGVATTAQTVYLAEVSPIGYRGLMGTLTGFSTSIGFVAASGIGLPQIFGRSDLWHFAYLLGILLFFLFNSSEMIPSIILIAALYRFLPPSPIRSLREGNEKESLRSLELFHSKVSAPIRLAELQRELGMNESGDEGWDSIWKESRSALLICVFLNATVGFSGIMAISFFGTFLLQSIGFSDSGAALANCLASFSGIFGNIAGSLTVDRLGRRLLIIGGLSVLGFLNICLMGLVFVFEESADVRTGFAFLGIFMIFLFVFSFGVGPMAWFLATELSEMRHRAKIQSMAVSTQYLSCFVSSLLFFPFYRQTGALSFLLFILPLIVCAFYLFLLLPETKNRPIDSIVADLRPQIRRTP